jgi:hypothetical protein
MTYPKPNAVQITAARAVLRQFFREGGATATDSATDIALFSIFSCMTGVGRAAAQYAGSVAQATDNEVTVPPSIVETEDGGYEVVAENVLGIPVGTVFREPEPVSDVMSLNELRGMNKNDLVACVRYETGLDITAEYGSKAKIIESLEHWRSTGEFPDLDAAADEDNEGGNDTVSGD